MYSVIPRPHMLFYCHYYIAATLSLVSEVLTQTLKAGIACTQLVSYDGLFLFSLATLLLCYIFQRDYLLAKILGK